MKNSNLKNDITTKNIKIIKHVVVGIFKNDKLESLGKSFDEFYKNISNEELLNKMILRYQFMKEWRIKINNQITYYEYSIKFISITINREFATVIIRRNIIKKTKGIKVSHKSRNEGFIILLEEINKDWFIKDIVEEEFEDKLYKTIIINSENTRDELITDYSLLLNRVNTSLYWKLKLSNIEALIREFNHFTNNRGVGSYFNKSKVVEYAERYALNYNKEYLSFDGKGGDCSNFVSQCIYAGGLPRTETWKPYTGVWIRVVELRDYLINNNLAYEKFYFVPNIIGSVVQFYNPLEESWAHSGIINYYTKSGDYLYSCHSINKLNWPIADVYPIKFSSIRILEIKNNR